jgi:membrane fusion protein (multidrug efflux system)
LYGDKLEIKNGLQAGDQLITEGFQSLYDGQLVTTTL